MVVPSKRGSASACHPMRLTEPPLMRSAASPLIRRVQSGLAVLKWLAS